MHRFRQVASAWLNGRLAKSPAVGSAYGQIYLLKIYDDMFIHKMSLTKQGLYQDKQPAHYDA